MISDSNNTRIVAAIKQAEARTDGEIFCIISKQSGDYGLVPIVWAAALALILPLPLAFATAWSATTLYLAQLTVFLVMVLVLSHPLLRLRIVPRGMKHHHAHAEAMRQFFAQGLDKTERRTGVLIFASSAERYAEIVADAGINDKVPQAVWDDAVAALVAAIKDGRPADGFIAAIEKCGDVLAAYFPPGAFNRDELPDRLLEL